MVVDQAERHRMIAMAIDAAADAQKVAVFLTVGGSLDVLAAHASKQLEAKVRKLIKDFSD
jgi:hypothetical protein